MKKIIFLLFIAVFLNQKNAYALASASQIAVNQSFVEKIPESKKEVFFKKIRKIAKFLRVEKIDDNAILAKLGFIFSTSSIVLCLLALALLLNTGLYGPYFLISILSFLLSLGGLTLGILYLALRNNEDKVIYKNLAGWAVVLSVLPYVLLFIF
jgi:hypothetical protein